MRYQGKITSWNDEKGFGFLTWRGGGEPIFVHVKAFKRGMRRSDENDIVTYELTKDERGGARAENVAFPSRTSATLVKSSGSSWFPSAFAALFLTFLCGAVLVGRLPLLVLGIYSAASLIAFVSYWADKSAARSGQWRTQEFTLLMFGLIGGWPSAVFAQKLLRHKSKKQSFQTAFWATVALNSVGLFVYSSPTASRALLSIVGVAMLKG